MVENFTGTRMIKCHLGIHSADVKRKQHMHQEFREVVFIDTEGGCEDIGLP